MARSLGYIIDALPALLQGAVVTLQLTAISVVLGLIGGVLLGVVRLSPVKPVSLAARVYIDFFRGTPLLVQLFMIYFGVPALVQQLGIDFRFNQLGAAITGLSLNSAAYLAEIVRAGIQSIEKGQWEAAEAMGLNPLQTMQYIVFPQALRRMIPPLSNEFVTLLKDTSLVAIIGYQELFRNGQLIIASNYRAFEIWSAVALIYLLLNGLSVQAFAWLERWMDPAQKSKQRERTAAT